MRCLIGVEDREGFESSLNMLESLRAEDLEVEAVHVIDAAKAYPGFGMFSSPDVPGELIDALRKNGQLLQDSVQDLAQRRGISCVSKMEWGATSQGLLEEASDIHADIVCVHRKDQPSLNRLFLGSVSRAMLLGAKETVFVTKGKLAAKPELTAVLGVDHSPYCMNCIDLLFGLKLKGIERILVVTALEESHHSSEELEQMRADFMAKNTELCKRFESAGIEASYEIADGSAEDVLHEAMLSSNADLMIVGAQGHGFMERLLVGSTSLHEVAMEPYPVLVLRV